MNPTLLQPRQVRVEYRGDFAEPVFSVLGNPAKLYSNLLRYLGPLGASANSLSINLAVLAQANVTCFIQSGLVRVWLDHLEVSLADVQDQGRIQAIVAGAWSAALDTDDSLRPIRHTVTLASWCELKDEIFSRYVRQFVTVPPSQPYWKPSVEFAEVAKDGSSPGSVYLAEAQTIPEGLFVRCSINIGAVATVEELAQLVETRYRAQLATIGLAFA